MGGVNKIGRRADGYIVRKISDPDIPAYHALRLAALRQHPEAFGETPEHFAAVTHEQIAARLQASEARGGFILGAFHPDGTLCGVVGLGRQEGEKMQHRAMLWGMYVAPKARGTGVGRALVDECLRQAAAVTGVEQVHLGVVTTNESALSLYRAAGFESYGREPAALKVGEQRLDEFLMVKFL
ncbi:MAG: N-acetyltransferase [Proteobacteria bacterium]|nr:N-acetyltransferase [Pseudomonadota bacterium]